ARRRLDTWRIAGVRPTGRADPWHVRGRPPAPQRRLPGRPRRGRPARRRGARGPLPAARRGRAAAGGPRGARADARGGPGAGSAERHPRRRSTTRRSRHWSHPVTVLALPTLPPFWPLMLALAAAGAFGFRRGWVRELATLGALLLSWLTVFAVGLSAVTRIIKLGLMWPFAW